MAMYVILSIALGGFLGSISRYVISNFVSKRVEGSFPYGTICVNIIGSFFLGAIISINVKFNFNHYIYIFLTTGFAGSFTTFSTAMYELYKLIEDKEIKYAFFYFLLTMAGGIAAFFIGYRVFI